MQSSWGLPRPVCLCPPAASTNQDVSVKRRLNSINPTESYRDFGLLVGVRWGDIKRVDTNASLSPRVSRSYPVIITPGFLSPATIISSSPHLATKHLSTVQLHNIAVPSLLCCLESYRWDAPHAGIKSKLPSLPNQVYVTGFNLNTAILLIHDLFG